ncbi:MAG: hypothetical protein KME13_02390 [Myxacorys californica WJT36-NPBG1]|jgi:hypothetical protein|nr:hypothetical protein [Myxacorys californica WJT36-NPBG1]
MNSSIQFQCGLSAAGVRVTSPLATVSVDSHLLILKAPLLYYSFKPNQIVALEVISKHDMCIAHTVRNYPADIRLKLPNAHQALEDIYNCEFLPSGINCDRISDRGWAIRSWTVIAFLFVWYGTIWAGPKYPELSIIAPLPVITLLSICIASIILIGSQNAQRLILKPGRSISEIKPAVYLLILLSGLMAIMMMLSVLFVPERFSKSPKECVSIVLQQKAWWCSEKFNR